MKPDETCYTCTKSTCTNGNGNDYEDLLKMLLKFSVPTVTVHKGNKKHIISFGAHCTTEYVFEGNDLMDMAANNLSFIEWLSQTFLLSKRDGAVITIYNK